MNDFLLMKLRTSSQVTSQLPYYIKELPYDPEYYFFKRKLIEMQYSLHYYKCGVKIKNHYYFVRFRHVSKGIYIFLYRAMELTVLAQLLPYELVIEKFGLNINCPITTLANIILPCITIHKGKVLLLNKEEMQELNDREREQFHEEMKDKLKKRNKYGDDDKSPAITPYIINQEGKEDLEEFKHKHHKHKHHKHHHKATSGRKSSINRKRKDVSKPLTPQLNNIKEEDDSEYESDSSYSSSSSSSSTSSTSSSSDTEGDYIKLNSLKNQNNFAFLPEDAFTALQNDEYPTLSDENNLISNNKNKYKISLFKPSLIEDENKNELPYLIRQQLPKDRLKYFENCVEIERKGHEAKCKQTNLLMDLFKSALNMYNNGEYRQSVKQFEYARKCGYLSNKLYLNLARAHSHIWLSEFDYNHLHISLEYYMKCLENPDFNENIEIIKEVIDIYISLGYYTTSLGYLGKIMICYPTYSNISYICLYCAMLLEELDSVDNSMIYLEYCINQTPNGFDKVYILYNSIVSYIIIIMSFI